MQLPEYQDAISHLNYKQMDGLSPQEIVAYVESNFSDDQRHMLIDAYNRGDTSRMGDSVLVAVSLLV